MGADNPAPTVIRPPDLPACSESLYRLSYRGPRLLLKIIRWTSTEWFPWTLTHLLFRTRKDTCQLGEANSIVWHLHFSLRFAEDKRLLRCDAVSLREYCRTFRRTVMRSSSLNMPSKSNQSRRFHIGLLDCEDGGSTSVRNVRNYTPDGTAHHRRLASGN
jgi:hypothetical protein